MRKITIQPPGNVITCNTCHIRSEWGKDIDITEVIKNINQFERNHENCDEIFESKMNIEISEGAEHEPFPDDSETISEEDEWLSEGMTFEVRVTGFKLELLRQQMKRSGKSAEKLALEGLYKIL